MVNELIGSEFEKDFESVLKAVKQARDELFDLLTTLEESDLERGRRGSWTIRQILEHVILGENYFADAVRRARNTAEGDLTLPRVAVGSLREAKRLLHNSRDVLLNAVDHVDEDAFYRFARAGELEFSVLSALENVASHDREHASQIRETLSRVA
jgi:uncharacterized damage-inducible protein DinB